MKKERRNHLKRGMKTGVLVGVILFLIYYGFIILLGIGLESSLGDNKISLSNFIPLTIHDVLETIGILLWFIVIPVLIGGLIGFSINKKKFSSFRKRSKT